MHLKTCSIWAIFPLLILAQTAHTLQASPSDSLRESNTASDGKQSTTCSALVTRSDSEFEIVDSEVESSDSDYKPAFKSAVNSERRKSDRLLKTPASGKKPGVGKRAPKTRQARATPRKTPETVSGDIPSKPVSWDTLPEEYGNLKILAEAASLMSLQSSSSPGPDSGPTGVENRPALAEEKYMCHIPVCNNKSFSKNTSLTRHYKKVHKQFPDPNLKCLKCEKQFWEIETLRGHKCKFAQGQSRSPRHQRNYPEPELIHLDDTQRRGAGYANCVCPDCKKRFASRSTYGTHWLVKHSKPGERTEFRCTLTPGCPYKTFWPANLSTHERTKRCGKSIAQMRKKLSQKQKQKQKTSIARLT